jgi:hypothetical protein
VPSPRKTTLYEHVSLINKKQQVDQGHEISPKIVTREQILKEPRLACSTNVSPLLSLS